VTVFPAQDLRVPERSAVNAQAVQDQTKASGPTAQASSDNTGTNTSNLPVIVGTVAAAILVGAAALILASRRGRHSEAADDAATLEPLAEDPERPAVLSDQTPN
jgi:LPXTG-motif cell wall-anchored protein